MLIININKNDNNDNMIVFLSLDNFKFNTDNTIYTRANPVNIVMMLFITNYMVKSLGKSEAAKPLKIYFVDDESDKLAIPPVLLEKDTYHAYLVNCYKNNIQSIIYKLKKHINDHEHKGALLDYIIKHLKHQYPEMQYEKTKIAFFLQDPHQALGTYKLTNQYTDYNSNLQDPRLKDMIDHYRTKGCKFLYCIIGTDHPNNSKTLRDDEELKTILQLCHSMLSVILSMLNITKN